MIFHECRLPADNFHEISDLIFFQKLRKMSQKLSSAAVLIGALRVKLQHNYVVYEKSYEFGEQTT